MLKKKQGSLNQNKHIKFKIKYIPFFSPEVTLFFQQNPGKQSSNFPILALG